MIKNFYTDIFKIYQAEFFPGFKPWHRKTNARKLNDIYKEYKKQLIEIFKSIDHVALTTDAWKRRNLEYYIALTAHFFDAEFNYYSIIIGFRKILGRHLAKRLKTFLQREINSYNIKDKIVAITRDNAADITKATSSGFGESISCIAHNMNLTLKPVVSNKKP